MFLNLKIEIVIANCMCVSAAVFDCVWLCICISIVCVGYIIHAFCFSKFICVFEFVCEVRCAWCDLCEKVLNTFQTVQTIQTKKYVIYLFFLCEIFFFLSSEFANSTFVCLFWVVWHSLDKSFLFHFFLTKQRLVDAFRLHCTL